MNEEELRLKLRKSMMGLLARREHSRLELLQKMHQKGFDTEAININLDEFTERDWQSDSRYSEMLLRSRILKCHGPVKINMELKNKGLSSDIITHCLNTEVDWSELALQALNKRFSALPSNQNEVNKQYRFLLQRGFNNEQIRWALKHQKPINYFHD